MERYLYATATASDDGKYLKDFLREKWRLSAALLSELKERDDGITVNGQRVTVRYLLQPEDSVRISVGDYGADSGFAETPMPLDILYEDSDVILLNKPPFLPVHPSKGHADDTLANGLTAYYHQKGETFVSRCVLRLDANTSGVVLFAKNAYAHDRIRRQFADGSVIKEYHALVHGQPPLHGRIDAPILRPEEATLKRIVHDDGKPSVTEYFTEKSDGKLSLLRVKPHTGRTHQIRLHLSHLGHPLVSDFLYGNESDGVLSRHGLHCSSVSFVHPVTKKRVTVKAPLAPDMEKVVEPLFPVERYRTLDSYLKETFGEKLVKLSLNAGFSCPNRQQDGRGCTFCVGGGDPSSSEKSITLQMAQKKEELSGKWNDCRYIAYFQAYTNTYAPVEILRKTFLEALSDPDVKVLSVATRPDCLGKDVLDLLSELNQIKPLWVELGLQTAHDETAMRLNRGYNRRVYETAALALHQRNITVITHLIFGLPGETAERMLESVAYAGRFSDGVKLQMLQILKGSVLSEEYQKNPFPLLSREQYVSLICDAIALLPPNVTVHRLTGDPPSDLLIAPSWTSDKKRVLAEIKRELERRDAVQGNAIK